MLQCTLCVNPAADDLQQCKPGGESKMTGSWCVYKGEGQKAWIYVVWCDGKDFGDICSDASTYKVAPLILICYLHGDS